MIEILLEIFVIDPILWGNGFKKNAIPKKSDKPVSTIIWAILIIVTGLIIQFVVMDNWMLSYVVLALSIRFALFNPIINISNVGKRRQNIFYLSGKGFDKFKSTIPKYILVFAELWVLLVGIMQYLYFSGRIYQDSSIFDLPVFY